MSGPSRIAPLTQAEFDALLASGELAPSGVASPGGSLNIERLWARHPALVHAQRPYQRYLNQESLLPLRDRELVILRLAWRSRSEYEWGHHVVISQRCGVSSEDVARVGEGPKAQGWSDHERAVLRATDELFDDTVVAETTWAELAGHYSTPQLLDFLSVVGRYWTVAIVVNSAGLQLEPGVAGFPEEGM